jgi:phage tail-like protein
MRAAVPELPSAHPIGLLLPGVYLEDQLAQDFVGGLDKVLAPLFLTVDCLEHYLDPLLTPGDFLPWLGRWVGVEVDERWPPDRARAVVADACRLQMRGGTRRSLVAMVELMTGGEVEVHESGGASWSEEPGGDPPGSPTPELQVIVRVADPSSVDRAGLERAIRDAHPAHLPCQVDLRSSSQG